MGQNLTGGNQTCFLQLIVQWSLPAYLEWRLRGAEDELHLTSTQKTNLLAGSFYTGDYDPKIYPNSTAEIAKVLLKFGADP